MPLIRLKSITIVLSLLLLFTSCKKDSGNNAAATSLDYYIKFTLDGNDQLFTYNAEGNMNVPAGSNFIFTGAAVKVANIATSNNLALSLSSTTQIKVNTTYVNYATASAGHERAVLATVSYIDPTAVGFNSWGDEYKSSGIISDSKISFSEISTTNLKGSFAGTSYKSISGTAEKHVITKGEFKLKRR